MRATRHLKAEGPYFSPSICIRWSLQYSHVLFVFSKAYACFVNSFKLRFLEGIANVSWIVLHYISSNFSERRYTRVLRKDCIVFTHLLYSFLECIAIFRKIFQITFIEKGNVCRGNFWLLFSRSTYKSRLLESIAVFNIFTRFLEVIAIFRVLIEILQFIRWSCW